MDEEKHQSVAIAPNSKGGKWLYKVLDFGKEAIRRLPESFSSTHSSSAASRIELKTEPDKNEIIARAATRVGEGVGRIDTEEPENSYYHCYLSYCWGASGQTHKVVVEIVRLFRDQNLKVWLHEDRKGCRVSIIDGTEKSSCFVVCLTEEYAVKASDENMVIAHELNCAQDNLQNVVILLLDHNMRDPTKWTGRIKFLFRNHKYFDLSGKLEESKEVLENAVQEIKGIHQRVEQQRVEGSTDAGAI